VSAAKLPDTYADDLIGAGLSLQAARNQIIDRLATEDCQHETRSGFGHGTR
jgi:hypothetical protein